MRGGGGAEGGTIAGGGLAGPLRDPPWGQCLGWVGGHGAWGGRGQGHTARKEVARPSLCLLYTGNKAGFHCVAQAMGGAVSILLRFASVCFRLGAAQRGRRGAARYPSG